MADEHRQKHLSRTSVPFSYDGPNRLKILTRIAPKDFRKIEAIGPKDTQRNGVK